MKKSIYILLIIIIYFSITSNSGGIKNASTTGCGGGSCHSSQKSESTVSSLTFNNAVFTSYEPGKTYSLTLTVRNDDFSNNSDAQAGFNLSVIHGILSSDNSEISIDSKDMYHNTPKDLYNSNSVSWDFQWKAPVSGTGDIFFNVASNVVNGNRDRNGDAWNLSSFAVNEDKSNPNSDIVNNNNLNKLTIPSLITKSCAISKIHNYTINTVNIYSLDGKKTKLDYISNDKNWVINFDSVLRGKYIIEIVFTDNIRLTKMIVKK